MKKKMFISYCKEDERYKHLTTAWSKNKKFDVSFDDRSTDFSVNSDKKKEVEKCIKKDIKSCDTLVAIVGKDTHKSKWVDFEIKTAHELQKKVVGVCTDKDCKIPESLEKYSDSICKEFNLEEIENIILGNDRSFSRSPNLKLTRIQCNDKK